MWWQVGGNAFAAVFAPIYLHDLRQQSDPEFPEWVGWPFALLSAVAAVSAGAVLRWRGWGVYGYAAAAMGIYGLNVYAGVGPVPAALGFFGTAVLLVLLRVGGRPNGWSQLEWPSARRPEPQNPPP